MAGLSWCRHKWGFPRRWPKFEGSRNVDVQCCSRCGTYRLSIVQFGRIQPADAVPIPVSADCQEAC
jgi:hypothetical protein